MGGAITADYWAACYSPRYFCVRSVDAYTVRVLSVAEWPWSLAKHGSVFTASPALANPYTISLSRYYKGNLTEEGKSGNTGETRISATGT